MSRGLEVADQAQNKQGTGEGGWKTQAFAGRCRLVIGLVVAHQSRPRGTSSMQKDWFRSGRALARWRRVWVQRN